MAIFRSDVMSLDPNKFAGMSTPSGPAYAPYAAVPAVPSVPTVTARPQASVPSTQSQINALTSRGSSSPPVMSAPYVQPTVTPQMGGIQSGLQSAAGAPAGVDPNLTQEAFLGNVASALARRGQEAQGIQPAPAQPTQNYVIPDANRQPTYATLTNEQLLARFKPELVQGADGTEGFSVTNAGLQAPRRSDFGSVEEYQAADAAFRENQLAEQSSIATSSQFRDALSRNAALDADEAIRIRTRAFEATQGELERRQATQRERLINDLATRGLIAGKDSFADDKLREFDRLAAQEREAKWAEYNLQFLERGEEAKKVAKKDINDRLVAIGDAMKKFEDAKLNRARITDTVAKTQLAEKKFALDEAYKMGVLDIREYEAKIKQLEAESRGELREAQTGLTEQKTIESETLTPIKAEDIKAGTAKKVAETERINTLTPIEVKEKLARINKLMQPAASGGKGGVVATDEDFNKAYDSLLLAGVSPTDKAVALAVRRLKGDVNPQITETALSGVTARTKAREEGKPKQTGADAFLQTLING